MHGGYMYRTECPRARGLTETEWSYRVYLVFPYVYSRSGCETHTATRVAFDAVGIWKMDGNE
jgi:hypothetical protein